jgi:hypothetical protein
VANHALVSLWPVNGRNDWFQCSGFTKVFSQVKTGSRGKDYQHRGVRQGKEHRDANDPHDAFFAPNVLPQTSSAAILKPIAAIAQT